MEWPWRASGWDMALGGWGVWEGEEEEAVRLRGPECRAMSDLYPEGDLLLVSPSDSAWRSKNYNMLLKEQRLLAELASTASEGVAEGVEVDASALPSPPSSRLAVNASVLDHSILEKLGLGHPVPNSEAEGKYSNHSSLLIDMKSMSSSRQESIASYGQESSISNNEIWIENDGFAVSPANLAKALRLLHVPPFPTSFENEEEMIQVYQLIYDTLRYGFVFDQALTTISFFAQHEQLQMYRRIVHLLFFELQQRQFLPRDSFTSSNCDLSKDVCIMLFGPDEEECLRFKEIVREAEDTLWDMRVHLAASLARLRIKRRAFCLLSMLPDRLRNPSHLDASVKRPLSFWINNFLIRKENIAKVFKDSGLRMDKTYLNPRYSSVVDLPEDSYFYDSLCTNMIFCNPSLRAAITHSQLIKQKYIIMQDRSFCIGSSTLCRTLNEEELRGAIVQTHISSLRVTAYLASLLNENKASVAIKPDVVLAFGAGSRKSEYEKSLQAMGITNVLVYSEEWVKVANAVVEALVEASVIYSALYPNIAISPDFTDSCISIPSGIETIFQQLDNAVAVYVTPPNSYSSVPDPVGLSVSRGGDIQLLEDITQSMSFQYETIQDDTQSQIDDIEELGSQHTMPQRKMKEDQRQREKMEKLIKDQWESLSLSLSLPQIQIVIYETHSMKDVENRTLVESVVKTANDSARMNLKKTQEEQPSFKGGIEESETLIASKDISIETPQPSNIEVEAQINNFEEVPLTDIFEVKDLSEIEESTAEDGCFISLIRRKELIHLNNRYLIQMAEARGLFGKKSGSKVPSPSESAKEGKKKRKGRASSIDSDFSGEYSIGHHGRNKQLEIERISAPTIASLRRSYRWATWNLCKHDEGRGECLTYSEEENFVYPCQRCASHGDDQTQFSLKVIDGRWWSKRILTVKRKKKSYAIYRIPYPIHISMINSP